MVVKVLWILKLSDYNNMALLTKQIAQHHFIQVYSEDGSDIWQLFKVAVVFDK